MTMSLATPLRHQTDGGSMAHSSSRSPSQRLSRSPKRARSTPSPIELEFRGSSSSSLTASTSSSASTSRSGRIGGKPHRRPEIERRGVSFERHAMTSPWRSEDGHERRREMSVPLLSQTLSSFSLSHSPDVDILNPSSSSTHHTPTGTLFAAPSPSFSLHPSSTPRRPSVIPLRTPLHEPLSRDHVYPSTAPLPQLPSFLGSPFSSKTARGRYTYHPMSPSKGVNTENLGYEGFSYPTLDWIDRSEWMVEEALGRASPENSPETSGLSQPSRLRRDTSGSTSSMDELSGSATSSASLLSLARSSGEHHHRPNMVAIWGEQAGQEMGEADGGNPETPSRQIFPASEDAAEEHLHMSGRSQQSPGLSPLVGRKSASGKKSTSDDISPLQAFLMARTPSGKSLHGDPTPSRPKSRSAFSNFLPHILSSKKFTRKHSQKTTTEGDMTDTDEGFDASLRSSTASRSSEKSEARAIGLGIELETQNQVSDRSAFGRSISSASSSGDIDPSPSKNPSDFSSSTNTLPASPLGSFRGNSLISRRKTMAVQHLKKVPSTSAKSRPLRPMLRRGITEPKAFGTPRPGLLSPATAAELSTPVAALFGDVKPSPAAFASTGLVKKKSIIPGLEIPKFGESEPKKRTTSPVKPVRSRLGIITTAATDSSNPTRRASNPSVSVRTSNTGSHTTGSATTSDASVSVYVRTAQTTRGLRRKTSSMFRASGSIGSIGEIQGDLSTSPLTPTKPGPGLRITPIGFGVATPPPTTPTNITYPFAPSTSFSALSSPPYRQGSGPTLTDATEVSSPVERAKMVSRPSLLRNANAPLARSSNPMLAASFRAQAGTSAPKSSNGLQASRLNKDFLIVQSLGKGEFSQVWKVQERSSGKMFAVKAGRPYTGYKNRLRQLEEVSILHQLSLNPHPHILSFVDSWEHASRLYIRTELAACGDLSIFLLSLGDMGGMGESRVWKSLAELSSGLVYIHDNNFLHLDLKPSNILITNTGSLKIADFGMSTILSDQGTIGGVSPALPHAVDGGGFVWDQNGRGEGGGTTTVPSPILDREVEGDREYLCPEALGDGNIGKEADVYSLGIMLLEAALNVVLPSNGDGWVKLRNDDLSDLNEHYLPYVRGQRVTDKSRNSTAAIERQQMEYLESACQTDLGEQGEQEKEEILPRVSDDLLKAIKGMMRSDPAKRMRLDQVRRLRVVDNIERMRRNDAVEAALVEEGPEFLDRILA